MSVEIKGDGAVEIGAVHTGAGGGKPGESCIAGKSEGVFETHRDDCESRFNGSHQFRSGGVGTTVVADFQQVSGWVFDSSNPPFDLPFRIPLQKN